MSNSRRTDVIRAKRLRGGIRASRQFGEGRVCARTTCDTKLSRYNRREHCHLHAPKRFPRVRGQMG